MVRFVQATPSTCIIDGTIDGLVPGEHSLEVHECGDLSRGVLNQQPHLRKRKLFMSVGCESVGKLFNPVGYAGKRPYGALGLISAQRNGRAAFRIEDNVLRLSDVIGRSLVVSSQVVSCFL